MFYMQKNDNHQSEMKSWDKIKGNCAIKQSNNVAENFPSNWAPEKFRNLKFYGILWLNVLFEVFFCDQSCSKWQTAPKLQPGHQLISPELIFQIFSIVLLVFVRWNRDFFIIAGYSVDCDGGIVIDSE